MNLKDHDSSNNFALMKSEQHRVKKTKETEHFHAKKILSHYQIANENSDKNTQDSLLLRLSAELSNTKGKKKTPVYSEKNKVRSKNKG